MNRGVSQAAKSRPDHHDPAEFGQVLPFRRPGLAPLTSAATRAVSAADADRLEDDDQSDDFAEFEQDQDEEIVDYRQRALMNVIALAVLAFLVSTGVWLADTIADMERDQDCMMQGRVNCAPIELPLPPQQ